MIPELLPTHVSEEESGSGSVSARVIQADAVRANHIRAGEITADKANITSFRAALITAGIVKTSNYAETGGVPTTGAKLDADGTALKVAPGGLQVGTRYFSDTSQVFSAGYCELDPTYGGLGVYAPHTVSVAVDDRGAGFTPQYVVDIDFDRSVGDVFMVATGGQENTANTILMPYVLRRGAGIGSTRILVGLSTPSGTWVNPSSYRWRFYFTVCSAW